MDPIAFSIGGVDVRWYSILILVGVFLASMLIKFESNRFRINKEFMFNLVFWTLIFGIIGARLYYVIFTASDGSIHYDNIIDVIDPRQGGLAIHGGVIGAMIFIVIYCKIKHIKILYLLEIVLQI